VETFEHFLRIMDKEGHIPEEHFDFGGIRMDKDINGKDVVRAATITQESYQQSKCLTHFRQVDMRLECLQIIKSKEIEKKETANLKHMELVEANSKVVGVICIMLQQDNVIGLDECGKEYVNLCMMKMFSELTNPQLEAFILAHDIDCMSKSQLPAKGKLKDAEDNTVRNCIRIAFDCRTKSNRIEGTLPFDLSNISDNNNEGNNWGAHFITLTNNDSVLPSTLISDKSWVLYAINLLDLEKTTRALREISSSDKDKADLLLVKLCERFKKHVNLRVKQVLKRNHCVLKLAWKNLSVVASIMLLSNHLKMELKCLGEHACLLAVNTNQFIPSGAFPNCEGAYLYFDGNRGVFVRGGKVVRQGFKEQGEEHLACAKVEKSLLHFYFLYPSMYGKRRDKRDKLGCFEHLMQVITAGFDPSSKPAIFLDKDHTSGGLLIINAEDEHRIKSLLKKDLTSIQKHQEIIAYLFEFGYDLAISPENNVSLSPGFETVLGVFGG
jgi:hypothetical protein